MKKILALVFALGAMTAVFAQNGRGRDESRDVILGQGNGSNNNRTIYDDRRDDGRYNNRDNGRYSNNSLEDRIARINREYDWKIESVQKDRYMKKGEKKRKIRDLENERNDRIREARQRFSENRNGRRY